MRMPGSPSPSISLCFCTCPDAATAERIAATLVEERLAACVSIVPGLRSVYRWKGAVERADEVLLLAKTRPDRYPALQDRVQALHPYELPELVSVETVSGLPAYLQWVAAQTRPEPDAE
jgi:periplasmic divalent cation tolerance protein